NGGIVPGRWAGSPAAAATSHAAALARPTAHPAAPAPAGRPVLSRARFVDVQLAPLEILAVQAVDRGLRLRLLRHLEEAEALGLAGDPVLDDGAGGHLAELLERLPELVLGESVREVAYVEVHPCLLCLGPMMRLARVLPAMPEPPEPRIIGPSPRG